MSGQEIHECDKPGCFYCYEMARITGFYKPDLTNMKLIDMDTRKQYKSIVEAANDLKMKVSTLGKYVNGKRANKTSLVFLHKSVA